jgi:pimeloyl-ACP methyl ester carboxylesterase
VFGAADPYLNTRVAHRFAQLFPNAQLQLINGARHYVQVDEPKAVADAILTAAAPLTRSNDNTNTPTPSTRPSSQPAP